MTGQASRSILSGMPGRSTDDKIGAMMQILGDEPGKLEVNLIPPAVTCTCGRDVKDVSSIKMINDPSLKAPVMSDICKGCREGAERERTTAGLICARCGRVVARIMPHKDKLTGFVMAAGKYYHIESCPSCTGKDGEYKIIEKVLWNRKFYATQ